MPRNRRRRASLEAAFRDWLSAAGVPSPILSALARTTKPRRPAPPKAGPIAGASAGRILIDDAVKWTVALDPATRRDHGAAILASRGDDGTITVRDVLTLPDREIRAHAQVFGSAAEAEAAWARLLERAGISADGPTLSESVRDADLRSLSSALGSRGEVSPAIRDAVEAMRLQFAALPTATDLAEAFGQLSTAEEASRRLPPLRVMKDMPWESAESPDLAPTIARDDRGPGDAPELGGDRLQ